MEDVTRKFTALDSKAEMHEILSSVYNSLMVKGYNPINQIVGYILSEDPTYITNYNNASTAMSCCRSCCGTIWTSKIVKKMGL